MEWVSTKQLLPPLYQRVIVFEEGFIEMAVRKESYKGDINWYDDEGDKIGLISYWMPLPNHPIETQDL